MITTTYDREADALYIRLAPKGTVIEETREVAEHVNLDFDAAGRLVGIEILEVEAAEALTTAPDMQPLKHLIVLRRGGST